MLIKEWFNSMYKKTYRGLGFVVRLSPFPVWEAKTLPHVALKQISQTSILSQSAKDDGQTRADGSGSPCFPSALPRRHTSATTSRHSCHRRTAEFADTVTSAPTGNLLTLLVKKNKSESAAQMKSLFEADGETMRI